MVDYSKRANTWRLRPHEDLGEDCREFMWWVGITDKFVRVAGQESLFMRANHSRKPNTEWDPVNCTLTANQFIVTGDEITFDYRKEIAPDSVKTNRPEWV